MKKILIVIGIILIFASAAQARIKTSGLVGAWAFEDLNTTGTATDWSGNGNNGTISGATSTIGKVGVGLSFDGFDDKITIADSTSLDITTGLSIVFWMCPTSSTYTAYQDMIVKVVPPFRNYQVYMAITSGVLGFYNGTIIYESTYVPLANVPIHVAYTVTSTGVLTIYVNAASVYTATGVTLTSNAGSLYIGGSYEGDPAWFKGYLDEVQIFNYALTQSEIQQVMLGLSPKE